MLMHCSHIDRLDVPARVIFKSPAVFKREALTVTWQSCAAAAGILVPHDDDDDDDVQ